MDVRYIPTPEHTKRLNTAELREHYLIENLFEPDQINLVYSHEDRMIIGAAVPVTQPLELAAGKELAAAYFAERREVGVMNVGGAGTVHVDGTDYPTDKREMVYISRGSQKIVFSSADNSSPARFFIISLPAHREYPTTHIKQADANPVPLGSQQQANERVLYQYIHEGGVQSCQLVMGFTEVKPGSVWNTMPPHTHDRRCEVYMYFDINGDSSVVFHFMGEPGETRHLVMREGDAVISPSWSIHAGAGAQNYCFIWAMGGENQAFSDMDAIPFDDMA